MSARTHRHRHLGIGLALAAAFALLALPAAASAATTLYYVQETGGSAGNGVFGVGLGAVGAPSGLFTEPEATKPEGIALDPATGKVYWTDRESGEIRVGGLGGEAEGAAQTLYKNEAKPVGIAVDVAAGKVYWTDPATGEIRVGGLGGEAEGAAQTLYKNEEAPLGLAVDAATGKLYWGDAGSGEIRVGAVTGESEAPAQTLVTVEEDVGGVAVDPVDGKIYWTNNSFGFVQGKIWAADLNGSEAEVLYEEEATTGETIAYGIAVDPFNGRVYWADYGSGLIRTGGLGGERAGETAETVTEVAAEGPNFIALLASPFDTAAPTISHPLVAMPASSDGASSLVGVPLSCSEGTWAGDVSAASFYQAPRSFAYQWLRDGTAVSGATSASFTPVEAGSYVCDVTASNAAGSTVQGSAAIVVTAPVSPVRPVPPPPPPPAPKPKPKPPRIVKVRFVGSSAAVKGGRAEVKLACKGDAECMGKLVLKVRVKVKSHGHGRHRKPSFKLVALGRASYTIAAGHHMLVAVKLSRQGRTLLAHAGHRRLKVKATAELTGGRNAHRGLTLALRH